ncbi:MAG: hypothetical protein JRF33_16780 [Deltaproteobacteria bacterium]|nr:hypothetical protein [Deltaproteobacteria bacterium]
MKHLPDRPQAASPWFEHMRRLQALAQVGGADEKALAYDLMSMRAGFGLPTRSERFADTPMRSEGQADFLWCLVWHLDVRAPALDLKWLLGAALALDKVHWGVFSLGDLLAQLEALELGLDDVDAWLMSEIQPKELAPLCRLASGEKHLMAEKGQALVVLVEADRAEARRIAEEEDLLDWAAKAYASLRPV